MCAGSPVISTIPHGHVGWVLQLVIMVDCFILDMCCEFCSAEDIEDVQYVRELARRADPVSIPTRST